MKKKSLNRLLISILLFCFVASANAQKHYKEIEYPELRDIKIPKVQQVTLSNGMKFFLLEDRSLPLIELSARIRTGSVYEPPDKIGLAAITGEVMRTGGTKTKTGDEIDEELERIAAVVETGIGEDAGSAYMSVLKKDIDTGLNILADVLMNPEFPEDKIELSKVQHRSAIARRNDNVQQIAFREFGKLIYGAESPYARHAEYQTVNNIAREDLITFHKKYYHPNNIIIGVWGDFDSKTIIKKIENAFKDWKKAELNIPPLPEVNYEFKQTVNLIEKEDVNQTNIVMGHIGGRYDHPDYHALSLTNRILGIGFTSRLFRNLRSRKGLAYSVFGVYSAEYNYPGVYYVGCQTKSESTVEAIHAMLEEVRKMTESEVTDEELAVAKESYLNSYVFNFDTKGKIVRRIMTYEYFGYPHDFLQKTKESIEKVTKADILRVSKEHLHPETMQILAVGRAEDFDQPLSVLGEVNEIGITIPAPEEEAAPEATEASLREGRKLLDDAIEVLGGAEAFKAIQTMKWNGSMTAFTAHGEMEMMVSTVIMMPDKIRADIQSPMGAMSQIMNGEQAWIVSPQGSREAPEQMKEQLQENLWHNVSYLYANADQEGLTVQRLGQEDVDGAMCEALYITPKDVKGFKLYVDAQSLLPVKMSFQSMNMMGAPAATEQRFGDFREAGNVKLPFKTETDQDGEKAQAAEASEILINVEVAEGLFRVNE